MDPSAQYVVLHALYSFSIIAQVSVKISVSFKKPVAERSNFALKLLNQQNNH